MLAIAPAVLSWALMSPGTGLLGASSMRRSGNPIASTPAGKPRGLHELPPIILAGTSMLKAPLLVWLRNVFGTGNVPNLLC